ncbi:hypothetical protein BPOR_1153g00040 [Botrytis porri]|uniref:Uncharacterized protein n=1 Tax=Botrytis porri TaxID=87229 RepID=A0A4Z1K5L7_9HELO|nr:hypothetical protein BPOR_1153g00040 [Botrytis porri]
MSPNPLGMSNVVSQSGDSSRPHLNLRDRKFWPFISSPYMKARRRSTSWFSSHQLSRSRLLPGFSLLTGTQADVATAMLAQSATTTASGASTGSASSSTATGSSASTEWLLIFMKPTSASGAIQQINAIRGYLIGGISILAAAAVANLA